MHYHVVHNMHRSVNEPPVQLNTAIGLTATPACSIVLDLYSAGCRTYPLLIYIDAKVEFFNRAPVRATAPLRRATALCPQSNPRLRIPPDDPMIAPPSSGQTR